MLALSFWNGTTNPPHINWHLQYNSTLILELDYKETTVSQRLAAVSLIAQQKNKKINNKKTVYPYDKLVFQ